MESRDLAALAREAMLARGLEPDFPPAAIAQAQRLHAPEGDHLPDQRHLPWCSIDNDDSRDLDQLTVAERHDDDGVRILVAIADVDALVAMGTPLDDHAQHNASSVYTPARIFPMLPERLSTDLTSLNPDADRVAIVISFTVDSQGAVGDGKVGRALVRNQAKLAYETVAGWLDGHGPMPPEMVDANGMSDQLRVQDETARKLRARRHEAGALDFEGTEARAVVADGRVAGLRRVSKN